MMKLYVNQLNVEEHMLYGQQLTNYERQKKERKERIIEAANADDELPTAEPLETTALSGENETSMNNPNPQNINSPQTQEQSTPLIPEHIRTPTPRTVNHPYPRTVLPRTVNPPFPRTFFPEHSRLTPSILSASNCPEH